MGYTTDFEGQVEIDPPLNQHEIDYLTKFAETRRMKRKAGPYFVEGTGFRGQEREDDVIDSNRPPDGQPGLWCQWVPTPDGKHIIWDGGEKFYDSPEWMKYLIDHFLKPGAEAQALVDATEGKIPTPFNDFTFDHTLNGHIQAQGEDPDDRWVLVVRDNVVSVAYAEITYGDATPI